MRIFSPTLERLMEGILHAGALSIRNIAGGEPPFVYSSGNKGPGYFMIKGLVSQRALFKALVAQLATKVLEVFPDVEYISGNVTGGMIPAWELAGVLEVMTGREVPYFYVRGTRKEGGHGEQITGDKNNGFFKPGRKGLVLEELVNYAQTTTNSAKVQREAGYVVDYAATIVTFGHAESHALIEKTGLTLVYLFTVSDLLDRAEKLGFYHPKLVQDYRDFLANPHGWQVKNGFTPTTGG